MGLLLFVIFQFLVNNPSDIFTKNVSSSVFKRLIKKLYDSSYNPPD